MSRLTVHRTPKMFIGGAFVRSESGHVTAVTTPDGDFLANVPTASRKDVRDAVVAARKGATTWAGATAYNRGQVLFRIAEMLEGRSDQFASDIALNTGVDLETARTEVTDSIDALVWYAGWPDKLPAVLGTINPAAGPYGSMSEPVPSGIVVTIAPPHASLLGVVHAIGSALATGCSVICLADAAAPLPAVGFAEVIATSDVPGGVVNILTGTPADVLPVAAGHQDVNVVDLTGCVDEALATACEVTAADTVKRVQRPNLTRSTTGTLARMRGYLETRTTWGTVGT